MHACMHACMIARPCVFATTRVFARPVFRECLRPPVSSRRRTSSPDLSSGRVFALPRVFTRTPVLAVLARPVFGTCLRTPFARPVFGTCLLMGRWLRFWKCLGKSSALGKCLRTPTCLRSEKHLRQEGVFKHPRVFAVFAWHVSADT